MHINFWLTTSQGIRKGKLSVPGWKECRHSLWRHPFTVLHFFWYKDQVMVKSFVFGLKVCLFFFFFLFISISWRLITLQYCSGFRHIHWHESAMELHVFPIPIPPPTSLSTWSLWIFPVHQAQALVSCIQPGLVICFTLDNIHVSMLFSQNIPPSPSPTES